MASEAEAFGGEPKREIAPEPTLFAFIGGTMVSTEVIQNAKIPEFMKFGLEAGVGAFVASGVYFAIKVFRNRGITGQQGPDRVE